MAALLAACSGGQQLAPWHKQVISSSHGTAGLGDPGLCPCHSSNIPGLMKTARQCEEDLPDQVTKETKH